MTFNIRLKRYATLALPATCWAFLASTTACGDDTDEPNQPQAGAGGDSGGKTGGGTAGKDNDGGEPTDGGKGGKGGTGGTAGTAGKGGTAGNGGTAGGAVNGGEGGEEPMGGQGGEGPAPIEYHPSKLNGPNGTLVPEVNDLRGITFSANGSKIWATGHVGASTAYPGGVDRQIAVVRFNAADGTLDTTFDGDGIKTFNLRTRVGVDELITNDGDEYSMGAVELPSGDLVILANVRDASGKGRDAVLLKMTPYGSLINWTAATPANPVYPSASVRRVDFGWTQAQSPAFPGAPDAQPTDEAGSLALNANGSKLVVFGHGPAKSGEVPVQRTDNDRYVVQLDVTTGAPDATFNAGQPFTFNSGGTNSDNSRRGKVEADGSIVSAGYANVSGANKIFVLRLSPVGVPDATFTYGTEAIPGVVGANPFAVDGGIAECYAAGRQSTGRYVTTGYGRATAANTASTFNPPWETTESVDLVSFGFKQGATGATLDTTFGVAGTLAIQSEGLNQGGTEDRGRDLVVLPDDRVVFVGRFGAAPAIMITTKDGELDEDEGGDLAGPNGADTIPGIYSYPSLTGSVPNFYAVALSPDKKKVATVTNNHADGALLAILNVE